MSRVKFTFAEHKKRSAEQCRHRAVLLHLKTQHGTVYKLIRVPCRSRTCPYCSRKSAQAHYRALRASTEQGRWRLLTLTQSSKDLSYEQQARLLRDGWSKFIKKVKKLYPSLQYARVIEAHKSGYLHFHAAVDCYLPFALLQAIWKKVAPNGSVHIKEVGNGQTAGYITGYIAKMANFPDAALETLYTLQMRTFISNVRLALTKPGVHWRFDSSIPDFDSEVAGLSLHSRDYTNLLGKGACLVVGLSCAIWFANDP